MNIGTSSNNVTMFSICKNKFLNYHPKSGFLMGGGRFIQELAAQGGLTVLKQFKESEVNCCTAYLSSRH